IRSGCTCGVQKVTEPVGSPPVPASPPLLSPPPPPPPEHAATVSTKARVTAAVLVIRRSSFIILLLCVQGRRTLTECPSTRREGLGGGVGRRRGARWRSSAVR